MDPAINNSVVNYKCPNCGAPLTFDIATQQWVCRFCRSTFTVEQLGQIQAELGPGSAEPASWQPTPFDEQNMVAYNCPSCGGRFLADKNTVSTFCLFCHNPTVLASQLQGDYRPAKIIPFQRQKDSALEVLRDLVKKHPLLPKSFKTIIERGEVSGLYVPYWLFSANYEGHLQGVGNRISTWTTGDFTFTKTDTYQVERAGTYPYVYVPMDASVRLDDELMDAIAPFDYRQLQDFRMEYLSGFFAEGFDVDAATSFNRFRKQTELEVSNNLRAIASSGYNSLNVSNLITRCADLQNEYAMLPLWFVRVNYHGKDHTFAMNGQTGKMAGKLPLSVGKAFAWAGSIMAVAALGILMVLLI